MSATKKRLSRLQSRARVFSALGDETRLELVQKLCRKSPQSISSLSEKSGLTRQGVTKHLRLLREAGIVRSVHVGRESLFEFDDQHLQEIQTQLDEIRQQWDDALSRLKAFVE